MPKIVRHIINISFAVLLTAALVASYLLGASHRKPVTCQGVSICIRDSASNQFIRPDEVRKILDSEYSGYIGLPIDEIDLTKIENILDGKSAIYKSEAYATKDSMLNVTITQRKPIVRFQKGSKGFYADETGYLFPLQSTYASHVQIVDGVIPLKNEDGYRGIPESAEDRQWLEHMINLVRYVDGSKVWKDKIVQITVEEDGNLTLVPREGKEKFIFGHPTDIESKFRKMELYYKGIKSSRTDKNYRWVDIRFDGQIVCREEK